MKEWVFFIVVGYLSGSVMYAYLLPKIICRKNVIELSEDHNPGAANAFRYAGGKIGILVILCELLKAFLPVYLGARHLDMDNKLFALVMIAPVVGHAYPCFLWGKGGKSIATTFGSLLGVFPILKPVLILACFYLLYSLVIVINPHLYRTVITYMCYSIASYQLIEQKTMMYAAIGMSILVIYRHFRTYQGEKLSVHIGVADNAVEGKEFVGRMVDNIRRGNR